jgi:predicted ester cyclase
LSIGTGSLTEANKLLAKRLMEEVLGQGHVEVLEEIFAEDAEYEGPPPKFMSGRAGIRQAVLDVHEAFEDWGPDVQHIMADGDLVVVRALLRGRHVGEWGGIPPSGREIAYPVIHTLEIHDGVITRYLDARDEVAMWTELGGVPAFLRPFLGRPGGGAGGPPGGPGRPPGGGGSSGGESDGGGPLATDLPAMVGPPGGKPVTHRATASGKPPRTL